MSEPVVGSARSRHGDEVPILRKFWAVMSPFFSGRHNTERAKSLSLLVACILLLMTESAVLVGFSYTQVMRWRWVALCCGRGC